jgi:hypothetical protein
MSANLRVHVIELGGLENIVSVFGIMFLSDSEAEIW